MDDEAQAARRARWLLAAGAAAGIALAASGLVRGAALPGGTLAPGEIARVNGAPIRAEELERLVAALERDRRSPVTDADRTRVLDRLIEEELLVQRAVEIGLVESEPGVRKALVQALVDSIVAEAESEDPEPEALRRFYDEHRDYFAGGERFRVERLVFRARSGGAPPGERAAEARRALEAQEPVAAVRERLADAPVVTLPDMLLPGAKLREYLGAEAVGTLLAAPAGAWTETKEGAGGVQLLRLTEREGGEAPAYEAVAPQVSAEWRRQQGDRALRESLDFLRAAADVVVQTAP
jgi:parvulin-like peptidyl-prolyl cis-trans isomerase-like protein